ncbi:unnamed protein product [Cylindrotheca closterium]|uniref:Uncharacterized protein n=1 Tax=Cylindrotheca closterium TaxID=2856 RepID=A0AAD2FXZ9_9STRA|nr:unnamed protein product [Cylindrotheca closterium]
MGMEIAEGGDDSASTPQSKCRGNMLNKLCLVFICAAIGFVTLYASPTMSLDATGVTVVDVSSSSSSSDSAGGRTKAQQKIRQISIIGERNSGTRWTFGHLGRCFNHSIKVTTTFTRYKHWFQFPDYKRYKHNTIVVAQYRNPYTWLKAMQKVPHHSPAHLAYRADADWEAFLSKEWTMERIGNDRWPNQTEPCQQFFEWKDIISCQRYPIPKDEIKEHKFSDHQPFYEMRNDGSGEPYNNIMDMRTDKIRNFQTVKEYEGVSAMLTMQYEYLVSRGTQEMLDQISELTGIEPSCKAYPAQNRSARTLSPDMKAYIDKHLNWTVEGWIGYKQQ